MNPTNALESLDGVDRISEPSIFESRSLAEFVRGVLNILTNLVKLFPEQTYYKFVRSTYSTTNPPRSEHIVAGTENLHVAVSTCFILLLLPRFLFKVAAHRVLSSFIIYTNSHLCVLIT